MVYLSSNLFSGSCFVVAEAGSNFVVSENVAENFEECFKLVDAAIEAKADCVKFQYFNARQLYGSDWKKYKAFELPWHWLKTLSKYCKNKDILLACSAFSKNEFDKIEGLLDVLKVASVSANDFDLIRFLVLKQKPLIVSTGKLNTIQVIKIAQILKERNSECGLLHCVSKYPTLIKESQLYRFLEFENLFSLPVGISDHSTNPFAVPLFCLGAGAKIIEKHFTLNKKIKSPDASFSISAKELKQMVGLIRKLEAGI